jgi:hypothetical protein
MSSTYRLKYGKFSEEDSRSLIMSSKLVHGINSSVLYEAVLAGVPVVVEGECLLKHHAAKADKLLAAMVFRQFDIEHSEFDVDKIEQFSHLNYKDTNCEQG